MTDSVLYRQLAYARDAEPTDDERAAVRRAARQASVRRIRRGPVLAILAVLAVAPAAAVAAGFGDSLVTFLGLAGRAPVTIDPAAGTVVDVQGGVAFTVTRNDHDDVCLQLGGATAVCDSRTGGSWAEQLADQAVVAVGTVPPADRAGGPVPLFALAGERVARVRVRYRSGPDSVREVGRGGVVLLVDAARGPVELIALDAAGARVGRAGLAGMQWTWCYDEDGCP